jgi:DinB superfamily
MNIHNLISEIKETLTSTFDAIDKWFDKSSEIHDYQPTNGGWTVGQVLEHTALTNHYLLILIDKGTQKALNNLRNVNLTEALSQYEFHRDKLTEVGLHQSFEWIRPEHMEPKGGSTLTEVRATLKKQLNRCYNYLDLLKNGEGVLYKTTMSVNDLGKIDVYEYIYFLAQHGNRHLTQMEKNEAEYQSINK